MTDKLLLALRTSLAYAYTWRINTRVRFATYIFEPFLITSNPTNLILGPLDLSVLFIGVEYKEWM
jgi:hypothetical protein